MTILRSKHRFSWILCGLFIVLFSWGCKNPFRTRESPPPTSKTEGTWSTPSKPENVIENLFHAYNEMVITNFERCLCDSFKFSAPEDSVKAIQDNQAELFEEWDRNVEVRVTRQIFSIFSNTSDSVSYELHFDPEPPVQDDITDSSAVLLRNYELVIFDMKIDTWQIVVAKGTVTFHLEQSSLNWCINFWSDIPNISGGYDWGDFKSQFR